MVAGAQLQQPRESPAKNANFFSKLFFCWLNPLITLGYSKDLDIDDLYNVTEDNSADYLSPRLKREWDTEAVKDGHERKPSFLRALFRCYKWQLLLLGVFTLGEEAARTSQPLLLANMLEYFVPATNVTSGADGHVTAVDAYMYALGLALTSAVAVLMHHPRYFYSFVMGMKMRIASCSLIYEKTLKLAVADSGRITNLVSGDVGRLDYSFMFIHYLWLAPAQAVVVLAIVWTHIGLASIPGYVLVVLLAVLQLVQGNIQQKLRDKTSDASSERIGLMKQIIAGMKVIKMYCWEKPFMQRVSDARAKEMSRVAFGLRIRLMLAELGYFTFSKMATASCVIAYILMYGRMPPLGTVLIIIRLLSMVQESLAFSLSHAVSCWSDVATTCVRIQEFLTTADIDSCPDRLPCKPEDVCAELNGFSGKWDNGSDAPVLQDVTVHAAAGELLAVVGPVGGGKSSMLMALLGELRPTLGAVKVNGRVAYAAQQPWIFHASLKDNILFGAEFQADRYRDVIEACALTDDIASLPHGDESVVGDKGVKLSGGQKARIGLARAVYSDADIYLLDDPLSAVDAAVADHLFQRCINGILNDRCRILVTHQPHFVRQTARMLVIAKGRVTAAGTYDELAQMGIDFAQMLNHDSAHVNAEHTAIKPQTPALLRLPLHGASDRLDAGEMSQSLDLVSLRKDIPNGAGDESASTVRTRGASNQSVEGTNANDDALSPHDPLLVNKSTAEQHEEAESVAKGAITVRTYWTYFRSGGHTSILITLAILLLAGQASFMVADWYIAHWASVDEASWRTNGEEGSWISVPVATVAAVAEASNMSSWMSAAVGEVSAAGWMTTAMRTEALELNGTMLLPAFTSGEAPTFTLASGHMPGGRHLMTYIYAGQVAGLILISCLRTLVFYQICKRASKKIHDSMFSAMVRAPMRFFDIKPEGQIINRFSSDIDTIDAQLPPKFYEFFTFLLLILGSVVLASCINPWVILPLAPVVAVFLFVRRYYLPSSRAVQRLTKKMASPVLSHLSSTMNGLCSVRAYCAQRASVQAFNSYQDGHTAAYYISLCVGRWLGIRLDWICVFFVAAVTFLCIIVKDHLNLSPELFGLTITYIIGLTGLFQWVVCLSTQIESVMTSVERVAEYIDLLPEAAFNTSQKPPSDWPQSGSLEAENVSLRYAADERAVLKSISFSVRGAEKIGICGRTGSGKSSLLTALFRLYEPEEGRMHIDGMCINDVGLHDLRSKLSIIPQDPVLFHTTVRGNLDPFGKRSDAELWGALQQVQLSTAVLELPGGLDAAITEGGGNFSVGQRQLLCLARALMHKNKLLMVDEATANVDSATDATIQETIRDKFRECTVLTIAHRLNTIVDSDRVLVLDGGIVREFDQPYRLLCRADSLFSSLARHTVGGYEDLLSAAKDAYDRRKKT